MLYINRRLNKPIFCEVDMNSRERKELRYQRRKKRREEKNIIRNNKYGSIDEAFCFHKVMYYADKCCKGVGFKKSTQMFKLHMFTNIATTCYDIKTNNYKVGATYAFTIHERGKVRNINAPHIKDRLVHKVLVNEILTKLYYPHFVYGNGASVKGKGFHFSLAYVKKILYSWYLKNGLDGYVLVIDYSNYFANCYHNVIRGIHSKYIYNSYTIKVLEDYLFVGDGLLLGVELAQQEALMFANKLDHFIDNKYSLVRFMDDSFCLVKTKEEGLKLLKEYNLIAHSLGIKINMKKTRLIPIREFFIFCKWKYLLLKSGKIICKPIRKTVYRQKRKLKKLNNLCLDGRVLKEEVDIVKSCFNSYLNISNCFYYKNYWN